MKIELIAQREDYFYHRKIEKTWFNDQLNRNTGLSIQFENKIPKVKQFGTKSKRMSFGI